MVQQTSASTLYIVGSGRRAADQPLPAILPRAELMRRLTELTEASAARERAYQTSGECPSYDPADYPGFTREQIERDLITPICGISANAN